MNNPYFEVIRPGLNTTFQDLGRNNQYHIGISFSGAMDKRNFYISNSLVENNKNDPALEFAYQGPSLKIKNGKAIFAITGNVSFKIIRNSKLIEEGKCYESYELKENDIIDILSTNQSAYGYFSVKGSFLIDPAWGSYSVNTKAKIGPNNGEKLLIDQKIHIKDKEFNFKKKKINYINSKIEYFRFIEGPNYNYFSDESKKDLISEKFTVSKLTDRMGMRLQGKKLNNKVKTNIKSEGLIKGVIQVPADGYPIIMLSDHGTIGGYPKIGVIISADYDKLVQLTPGSIIKLKKITLHEAEKLYKFYEMETENLLSQII